MTVASISTTQAATKPTPDGQRPPRVAGAPAADTPRGDAAIHMRNGTSGRTRFLAGQPESWGTASRYAPGGFTGGFRDVSTGGTRRPGPVRPTWPYRLAVPGRLQLPGWARLPLADCVGRMSTCRFAAHWAARGRGGRYRQARRGWVGRASGVLAVAVGALIGLGQRRATG